MLLYRKNKISVGQYLITLVSDQWVLGIWETLSKVREASQFHSLRNTVDELNFTDLSFMPLIL